VALLGGTVEVVGAGAGAAGVVGGDTATAELPLGATGTVELPVVGSETVEVVVVVVGEVSPVGVSLPHAAKPIIDTKATTMPTMRALRDREAGCTRTSRRRVPRHRSRIPWVRAGRPADASCRVRRDITDHLRPELPKDDLRASGFRTQPAM
jgi:hypothetical protein